MTTEHKDLEYLKGRFEDGDRPTGDDFARLIDSCHNTRHLTDTTITGTLSVQGGLTVDGSINTRDVAADGAKLDSLDSFVRSNSDSWEESEHILAVSSTVETVSSVLTSSINTLNHTLSVYIDQNISDVNNTIADNDQSINILVNNNHAEINTRVDTLSNDLDATEDDVQQVITTVSVNSAAWGVDQHTNKLSDLSDVNVTSIENNDVLKYNSGDNTWYAARDLHGEGQHVDRFVELTDTPVSYDSGNPGEYVTVNPTGDALMFSSLLNNFEFNRLRDDFTDIETEVENNAGNWTLAYGWGDHAQAGYLTTETDPIFTAHVANNITQTNMDNWSQAYGWGDHSSAGYVTDVSGITTTLQNSSGDWEDTYTHVKAVSSKWAVLDSNGVLMEDQIPELSITQTYTVQNTEEVATLNPAEGIQRGDIVIVYNSYDNLVAKQDNPSGVYDAPTKSYSGYSKLARPDAYVTAVNDKYGNVVLTSDDIDDSDNTNKWVEQTDIDRWNSSLNTTGGTMTGDLDTTARILSGGTELKDIFLKRTDDLAAIGGFEISGTLTANTYATKNTAGDSVVGITKNVNIGGNILHIVNGIIVGVTDA